MEQFIALQVKAKPRLAVRPKGKIREGKKTRLRVKLNRPVAPGQTVEIQAQAPTGCRWRPFDERPRLRRDKELGRYWDDDIAYTFAPPPPYVEKPARLQRLFSAPERSRTSTGLFTPQGPQPCASTSSATGA